MTINKVFTQNGLTTIVAAYINKYPHLATVANRSPKTFLDQLTRLHAPEGLLIGDVHKLTQLRHSL